MNRISYSYKTHVRWKQGSFGIAKKKKKRKIQYWIRIKRTKVYHNWVIHPYNGIILLIYKSANGIWKLTRLLSYKTHLYEKLNILLQSYIKMRKVAVSEIENIDVQEEMFYFFLIRTAGLLGSCPYTKICTSGSLKKIFTCCTAMLNKCQNWVYNDSILILLFFT
jgi:hypothetical protein